MSVELTTPRTGALRADCARCCGLCCVAPAFDADQGFGFDKPAHLACRHLGRDHRCNIHADRAARGFNACTGFDCYGAGQRVTELFGGRSWQASPQHAARMFGAYSRYRVLHELMACLDLAIRRASRARQEVLEETLGCLETLCRDGIEPVERIDLAALRRRMHGVLRELG